MKSLFFHCILDKYFYNIDTRQSKEPVFNKPSKGWTEQDPGTTVDNGKLKKCVIIGIPVLSGIFVAGFFIYSYFIYNDIITGF
jgi:hypothetical protein